MSDGRGGHEVDAIEEDGIGTDLTHVYLRALKVLPCDVEEVGLKLVVPKVAEDAFAKDLLLFLLGPCHAPFNVLIVGLPLVVIVLFW